MIESLEVMDLTDRIREMSGRIAKRLNSIKTEEATKTALVLPFITHVLGFNVFDPDEVVPEYTADVGTKKGEKVDYAIVSNGSPIMLILFLGTPRRSVATSFLGRPIVRRRRQGDAKGEGGYGRGTRR